MMRIMKFGGTSVANAQAIGRAVAIIKEHFLAGEKIAVVVSAQSGVTDTIIRMADRLATATNEEIIRPCIEGLEKQHLATLQEVAPDRYSELAPVIQKRLQTLSNFLHAVYHLRELTPRSRDYISVFGERLSAPVVGAALMQAGVPSVVLDGCEAGILTTAIHGDAIALPGSAPRIKHRVLPLMKDAVPVIMGFMGCTEEGIITTLGRSGSDYTASIIGNALDADEIWIWTDVNGIMTTDPRLVDTARVIPSISYIEVMELSYFGAKVMHSRSIEPAMQKNIPVWVKNTFNPTIPGTCITKGQQTGSRVVKAITYIDRVAAINITGASMIGRPGVAKTIFSGLAGAHVNVMMISQASSEANISLIVEESQAQTAVLALKTLIDRCMVREVTANTDVCAVAVVGAGMAGALGTAGRTFTALGKAGINVMMISQGSSEVNISFVVSQKDGPEAVRILHDEFLLSEGSDE